MGLCGSWQPERATIPASWGLLLASGEPSGMPGTHSASQHWQLSAEEGDNQGIHAIPGRKELSTHPLQHFSAALEKAACPELLCHAGGLNSLLPKGKFSP